MRAAAPLVILFVLTMVPASRAQEAVARYLGRPIAQVRLLSEQTTVTDPDVLNLVDTRVGQPLSMVAVRESITHLFSLGRFEDIQVEALDTPEGGLVLQYRLTPLHAVQSVDFRGRLGMAEGLLRQTVAERFGATPPVGRAADVARTLEQLYADHGYYHASVRPVATERHDPDRTLLAFDIDAGTRATISSVDVVGDPLLARAAFLRRLDAAPGDPYERATLQEKLTDYVQRLRQKGRFEAAASQHAELSADGASAALTIEIHPGPPVVVRFEGDPLPADKAQDLVLVRREASVDEDLLEDSVRRITTYLNDQGYWKATVTYRPEESPAQLAIVFTVRKGLLYRVAEPGVEVRGAKALAIEELRPLVKIVPHEVFLAARLDTAAASIADLYRRRGFAAVKIDSAANELNPTRSGEGLVNPVITINEGPETHVGEVRFAGNASVSEPEIRAALSEQKMSVRTGDPFYAPQLVAARDAVTALYLNEGFASASVQVVPAFNEDRTRADITIQVAEGPRTLVDHVLIVGNTHTDRKVIERELTLRPGRPLGAADLNESRRRLIGLGLFRRVQITPLTHGSAERRDILVTVEEAPATSMDFGGGLEAAKRLRTATGGGAVERYEFAPRGFFDIGRRNIGGRNRTINLYTRVSLRPRDAPQDAQQDGAGFGFSEYRVVATYREPRTFGSHDVTITGALEQGIRSSFNFTRKGVNAEVVRRLSPAIRLNARYSFNTTRTFDERLTEEEQANIDRVFPRVRLSLFSGAIARDTRDDLLDPTAGTLTSAEGTLALRALGGQVGFMKTYLQGLWFHRVPGGRRIVFASRAAIGLADGFPRATSEGTIEDLPASERFFAGGDTTIRGYALDTVGTIPKSTSKEDIEKATISPSGFPKGGNAVLIANAELRVPVGHGLGAVAFVDGGNVFNRVTNFDFGELEGAAGFGLRYRSPIGPIRVDVGFKMNPQPIGGLQSRKAIHLSIGQAF